MNKKISILVLFFSLLVSYSVSAQQLKGDPWIFNAYKDLYNRQPTPWELNIQNYNLGSWNSYAELKGYIQQYFASLNSAGISTSYYSSGDKTLVAFHQGGKTIAVNFISNDGGSIIAAGASKIISGGAGNIISGGAGNIISGGAGNFNGLPGLTLGNLYTQQSVDTKVIKASGKGAFIIRK